MLGSALSACLCAQSPGARARFNSHILQYPICRVRFSKPESASSPAARPRLLPRRSWPALASLTVWGGDTAVPGRAEPWWGGAGGTHDRGIGLSAWNQDPQTPAPAPSPAGKDSAGKKDSAEKGSPGHIFWVVPAYKVEDLKNVKPLTPREKFNEWARASYDPLGLATSAVEAALEHSPTDGFCGYGHGWGGYGECYGSALLDSNDSSFFGDFLFPVILHQDPRYFRLGQGSFPARVLYAVSRVFITPTDSGRLTVASGALAGTVIGAAVSNLYYPTQDRGFSLTLSRIGWDLGGTAIFNLGAEFWPDIKRGLDRTF